jgi:hypothetical protein
MLPDLETALLAAHRANIARYRQILDADLPAEQRRFVAERLSQEQAAIERLIARDAPAGASVQLTGRDPHSERGDDFTRTKNRALIS